MDIYIPVTKSYGQTDSTAVNGTTWTKLFTTYGASKNRVGIQIKNNDPSVSLWVVTQNRGDTAPTNAPTASQANEATIGPGQALFIPVADSIDVYVATNSGGAGTANQKTREYFS